MNGSTHTVSSFHFCCTDSVYPQSIVGVQKKNVKWFDGCSPDSTSFLGAHDKKSISIPLHCHSTFVVQFSCGFKFTLKFSGKINHKTQTPHHRTNNKLPIYHDMCSLFFGAEKNLLAKIYGSNVIMLQVSSCYWDQNQITVLSFYECIIQQCCFNCNHHTSGAGMIYDHLGTGTGHWHWAQSQNDDDMIVLLWLKCEDICR